jgi:hypothetical protein
VGAGISGTGPKRRRPQSGQTSDPCRSVVATRRSQDVRLSVPTYKERFLWSKPSHHLVSGKFLSLVSGSMQTECYGVVDRIMFLISDVLSSILSSYIEYSDVLNCFLSFFFRTDGAIINRIIHKPFLQPSMSFFEFVIFRSFNAALDMYLERCLRRRPGGFI